MNAHLFNSNDTTGLYGYVKSFFPFLCVCVFVCIIKAISGLTFLSTCFSFTACCDSGTWRGWQTVSCVLLLCSPAKCSFIEKNLMWPTCWLAFFNIYLCAQTFSLALGGDNVFGCVYFFAQETSFRSRVPFEIHLFWYLSDGQRISLPDPLLRTVQLCWSVKQPHTSV